MNILWYHEMNIWDCIYRALEIKKQSVKTQPPDLNQSQNPDDSDTSLVRFDDDKKSKIYEESGPIEDSDYEQIFESCKTEELERELEDEDKIIFNVVDKMKSDVLPKKSTAKDKDKDVIKLINKNTKPYNIPKIFENKSNAFLDKVTKEDDLINSIQRNIDKKLKKTVNSRVVELISNNQQINSINKPREEIYQRIAHKIYEAQEEHKLYFGETITKAIVNGRQMKQVNTDAKLLILYVSNLLLFSKKSDAIKAIDEYGKYFYDKHLCEANLRKLKALALMNTDLDLKTNDEAIREFIKAKILFEQNE